MKATDHIQRISKLEGAVQGIENQISTLIKHQDERDRQQSKRDEILFKKLDETREAMQRENSTTREMTRPNFATWAAWAAVIVVVIFGVYAPFSSGLNEKVLASARQGELADKLQQQEIENLASEIRHLNAWQDDQMKSDLDELRARRFRDSHP